MAPSVIGEDLTVEGNVISKGEVQLEGEIKGDCRCASLVIGDKALIEGGVLADDVIAVVDYLAEMPEVDADRIGLIGASQAGWLMPLAASRSDEIDFIVSLSGATSSVGISDRFDAIAENGLSQEEVAADLASFDGTLGFDPRPVLEELDIPVLWLYGGRDESNPTAHDIAIIEEILAERDSND